VNLIRSPKELLEYYYNETCALRINAALDVLHPDFRSLTDEVAPTLDAFMSHYSEVVKHLDRVDHDVQLVVEEPPWIAILHTFTYTYKDGAVENYQSSDYYRVAEGMFIEHRGVILQSNNCN
jgi:hypothetical protein